MHVLLKINLYIYLIRLHWFHADSLNIFKSRANKHPQPLKFYSLEL